MQIGFLDVLITVFCLVLLAVPGFLLVKTKVLKEGAVAPLSALVLYGCQPVMVFMSFQKTKFTPEIAINMLIVAGLALGIQLLMVGFTYLIIRNKGDVVKRNVVRFASVFSNCGYMGLPFLQSLFSGTPTLAGEIMIYGGIVIATFNLLTWSIGIYMMTGDIKQVSVKKSLLNPTVIGLFLGIIVFLTVQTPFVELAVGTSAYDFVYKLMESLKLVSDTVTPLSMIVVGARLASVNLKELFLDKWAYFASFNKLIVMSILIMVVVAFLPISNVAKYAVFFCLSMPAATGTVMFAVNFGGDSKTASVIVLLSTVLSIVSIPLMFLLFSGGFGVTI